MTVKQETLIYQPYYDLEGNSVAILIVMAWVILRFKFFWIFVRVNYRILGNLRNYAEIQKTSVRGNTEEKRSMCCSCRLGKVRSIISFPTHLKGENQMRVYSSFGVLLQAVI